MTSKEALDRLKFIADKELNTGSKSYKDLQEFWNYKEPLNCIEKLVERDTPVKPIINIEDDSGYCPMCNKTIWNHYIRRDKNFCDRCGQKLDRSNL